MPYITLDPALATAAPVLTVGAPLSNEGETLASIRGELIPSLGGRLDIEAPRYDLWINQAYIDLCSSLDIETLYSSYTMTTVSGSPLYMLPRQVSNVKSVSVTDAVRYRGYGGRPLEKSDFSEYRMARDLSGEPRSFFRHGKMLVLYGTPNSAFGLSVDFRVRPDKLVNNEHSPIIPWEFHEGILLSAKQKGYSALMEFDKAMAIQNELVAFIRRKRDEKSEEDAGRVVASAIPQRHRDLYRGNTPRELGD